MKNIHVYVKNFIVTYSLKCYTIYKKVFIAARQIRTADYRRFDGDTQAISLAR